MIYPCLFVENLPVSGRNAIVENPIRKESLIIHNKMSMSDMFARVKAGIGSFIRQLRSNMFLLFIVAVIVGGLFKLGVSQFITIGYNDYLTEKNVGFDFAQMKQDVDKKNQEAQQQGGQESANPAPAACGA